MSKKRSQRKNSNYNYRPGQKAGEDPQALQENSRTEKIQPRGPESAVRGPDLPGGVPNDGVRRPAGRRALCVAHPGGLILLLVAVGIQFQFWRGPKSKIPKGPRS